MNSLAIPALSLALMLNVTDVLAPFVDGASRDGQKGNERYAAKDWEHAVLHYQKATEKRPDGAFQYNLGTAAYQKKDFKAASQAFSRATADTKMDPDRAAYNLGNTRFKAGDLQGALSAYRRALSANPNDTDARLNYELTLRQLKSSPPDSSQNKQQQQDKQNQKNGQDKDQQNQSGQNQKQDQNNQNQNQNQNQDQQNQGQQDQQNQTQQNQGQDQPEQQHNGQPDQENKQNQPNQPQPGQESKPDSTNGTPPKPGQMTPAEAKRLLNAVTPEERELLQARLKATRKHRAEKDW